MDFLLVIRETFGVCISFWWLALPFAVLPVGIVGLTLKTNDKHWVVLKQMVSITGMFPM